MGPRRAVALAVLYAKGRGVIKSDQQAVAWYRKAAEQGNADAQFNLGLMYAAGSGVPADDQQASSWYVKAADQGNAKAQFKLGVVYATGRGVQQNDYDAITWYRKAADQGYAPAEFNLGTMHATGKGAVQDDKEAVLCGARLPSREIRTRNTISASGMTAGGECQRMNRRPYPGTRRRQIRLCPRPVQSGDKV
jgi:hypothetical protein